MPKFFRTSSRRPIRRGKKRLPGGGGRVSGEDDGFVQYTLDDPDEYQGETIVIVGAGDAAIENAVALSRQNSVIIINRRDEFARAKDGNLNLITRAIDDGSIKCFYSTNVASVESGRAINLNTETGQARVECDRVIARLGATGCPVIRDRRLVAIVTPADGPSFGMAPAGTCTCTSLFSKISGSIPKRSAWLRIHDKAA